MHLSVYYIFAVRWRLTLTFEPLLFAGQGLMKCNVRGHLEGKSKGSRNRILEMTCLVATRNKVAEVDNENR